jgi:hypothetical protein
MALGDIVRNLFPEPDPTLAKEHKDTTFDFRLMLPMVLVVAALIWYRDVLVGLTWPIVVLACVYLITACVKTCVLAYLNNDLRKWNTDDTATAPSPAPPAPAKAP